MPRTISAQLEALAHLRHERPAAVIAEALDVGIATLYRESVLALYLQKKLSRRKATQLVGAEGVRVAEQQDRATQRDIAWGLGYG